MAESLQDILERLSSKSSILMERYAAILEAKRAADSRIAELETENEKLKVEIERQKKQVEYLQIARSVSFDRETVESNRAFLSDLLRDIDKSIAQLSE
ncbi:MAG: hypothetical protein IJS19_03135 [Muribaculaceae bacterium]|nr:hypothetical protein [Muribaculaceae bacterium]MBQ7211657.1 hypothetical protein [Muribaculaceae bacterium]